MQQFRNILKRSLALFLMLSIVISMVTVGESGAVLAAETSVNTGERASAFGTLLEESTQFIVVKHRQLGGTHYAYTDGLSDERNSPEGNEMVFNPGSEMVLVTLSVNTSNIVIRTEKTLLNSPDGVIRDPDVSEDGKKVLFSWKKDWSDDFHLYEMNIAEGESSCKQLTFGSGVADVEPKYLANGKIVFNSSRCISNVDCWKIAVMNMYTCNADGSNIMRLGYDQVHTTYPTTTADGRILYTRWDYNDRNQMFVQSLFQMFPDGTNQTEVYGNDSNFPTTLLHTREVPGSTGLYVSISSGHHTAQKGRIVLIDTNKGRNGAASISYPFEEGSWRNSEDGQNQSAPFYKYPVALNDHEFLVSYTENYDDHFGIYYMNSETGKKICISDYSSTYDCGASQVAMVKKKDLFERPSMVNQAVEYGTYYMGNVYKGGGLEGVEFGAAKYLRVVELEYRPYAIGATNGYGTGSADPYTPVSTGNGAWDVKRVLGIVEIEADGSALFRVPANTPIYFQVLNEDGEMIQSMRSWSTLMPNETFSCVGCHEDKNTVPPYNATTTIAMSNGVQELQPDLWMSEEDGTDYEKGEYDAEEDSKGFSYTEMVQPILDANCITCHNDQETSLSMIGGTYSSGGDSSVAQTTIEKDGIPLVELGSSFKYTTAQQSNNTWRTSAYSSLSWSTGNAPFGTDSIQGHAPNTYLDVYDKAAQLYLRKDFTITAEQYSALASYDVYLRISYDQDPVIYLNGTQIFAASDWTEAYYDFNITNAFVKAAVSGNNKLAAYDANAGGGMFIDFAIYLVPKTTLVEQGSSFKYTTTKQNNNDWLGVNFNDSSWATGYAPFGTDVIDDNWPNTWLDEYRDREGNFYLRSSFSLPPETYEKIRSGEYAVYMNMSWDEDPTIYVNGKQILSKTGYTTSYQTVKLNASVFLDAVKVGVNTLAVSFKNTGGGIFLDFNIYLAKSDASSAGTVFSLEGTAVAGPREKIFYSLSYLVLTDSHLTNGIEYVGNSVNNITNWISSMSQCEMLVPYQYGSTQSNLITMLKSGHQGTKLTEKEIDIITAWIDLGVPFRGAYDESTNWGLSENREATEKQNKRDYYDALDVATKRISTGTVATDALPITISYTASNGKKITPVTDNGMAILYPEVGYSKGDKVTVTLPKGVEYFFFAMDARIGEALIYCPSGTYTYTVPADNMDYVFPFTFSYAEHPTISARIATAEELAEKRNLAVNPYDVTGSTASVYPHASASTEYNTSEFAARNAIDGSAVNEGHGNYPLQSWGAAENDKNLWYQVDFGKNVYVDMVDIAVRSDWSNSHDTYFTNAVLEFSDGSKQTITLTRTSDVQSFAIEGGKKETSYVKISDIKTAGGTWSAISEVEVYGSVLPFVEVPLTGISINKSLSLAQGESATLQITYLPETTTDDKTATWICSNPSVATVNSQGKVVALKEGTATITAKVGNLTATCALTVTKSKEVRSITVASKPTKTSYYVGDTLNASGLKLQVNYTDGSTQIIDSGITVPSTTFTTAGKQTITVAYGGKTTTFEVTVEAVVVSKIEVVKKPTKQTYTVGETVNTSGMQLKVTYNNGKTETVTGGWSIKPNGQLNNVCTQTVEVTYGGKTATFTVNVVALTVSKIEVITEPTKQTYTVGETINTSGMKLKVTYSNGTTATVTSGWTIKPSGKLNNACTQTVQVTYGGKTATFTVVVNEPTVSKIEIATKPTKLTYTVGETINTSGMKLKVTYSNGATETVTSGWSIKPNGKLNNACTQTVTVSYAGKSTTYMVTVNAPTVSKIEIVTKPSKLTYTVGESLNTSGMKLKVTYSNGATETVTSGWSIKPNGKLNNACTQTVTVSYAGKSTTYTVTVKSAAPTDITSSVYTIDRTNKYVSKIKVGTTVSTLLNGINEKAYCKVYDSTGKQVTGSTVVGTGMTIKLLDGNIVVKTYYLVVTGDVNGDGDITVTDMVAVKSHILRKSTLSGAKAKAADTNGDGSISITDFVQIKSHILKKGTITAR